MIQIVPLKPEHIDGLEVQPAQRMSAAEMRAAIAAPMGDDAWAVLAEGKPVACGGLLKVWDGRAYAWALLGVDARRHLKSITKAARRGIETCGFRRVEMAVQVGFREGQHWARMLGFTLETPEPMRAYLPNGKDAYLYAKVST